MSVEPRQAASLILLRDSADGPEVLLVQRNPEQRFMGGMWVFPGGAVDAHEMVAEADLAKVGGSYTTPPEAARMLAQSDRVMTA